MNILVISSGAREHIICKKLSENSSNNIFNFAETKNPGIDLIAKKIKIGDTNNNEAIVNFAKENNIELAIAGPEAPIVNGVADELKKIGIKTIMPTKKLAQLEGSKSFTRNLLSKYDIKGNIKYKVFNSEEGMREFCEECTKIVVKYDGLLGGKGVKVQGDHFTTLEEGINFAKECISKIGKVVIEEMVIGQEFSCLYFVDGSSVVPMPVMQDNKRALEKDKGANTGGMGTISDHDHSLPFLSQSDINEANEISVQVISALQAETEEKYQGILFGGFMATKDGVKLIEYNVRFGDPEVFGTLSLLQNDLTEIFSAIYEQKLEDMKIEFLSKATVTKYVVPNGYPDEPLKNKEFHFHEELLNKNVQVFFGSLEEKNNKLYMKGSRTMAFVATADNISKASDIIEESIEHCIDGELFHRKDIGTPKFLSEKIAMMKLIRMKKD